jgi:glycosyltransferase involved in cell wall biosynthesis
MKPRGLMVIHQFRPIINGAELQAERLAVRLRARGHPMQVLTELRVPGSRAEEDLNGIQIHRSRFKLAYWVAGGVENTFRYLCQARRSYDILHVHQAFGHAVVSIVAARVLRKRCIVKVACAGSFGDLSVFSGFDGFPWALSILKQADYMIAVSRDVEQELIAHGFSPQRIARIPNGVDTDFFRRRRPAPPRPPVRFIHVGRRVPQKGVDLVLQATRLLIQRGLAGQFEIKLYGLDYPEHNYRSMAAQLDVDSAVEFLPHQEEIRDALDQAHAVILPSRGEGMPNVVLEGMSFELPVIVSRVSGAVDLVQDGADGILIPVESPPALADAMQAIIQDPEFAIRLGRRARQKMISDFSLDSIAQRYSALYERMCAPHEKAGH